MAGVDFELIPLTQETNEVRDWGDIEVLELMAKDLQAASEIGS